MTLNDIIVAALAQLDRGHDAETVAIYRSRLTQYANEAQKDLAETLGFTRTEEVPTEDGILYLYTLERRCTRIERICQRGKSVPFRAEPKPGLIMLPYAENAVVTYRFVPNELVNDNDVSELDDYLHPLIVSYVVGRERMGGDVATQDGANIYLSMYNAAKAKLRGYLKSDDAFRIVNRW